MAFLFDVYSRPAWFLTGLLAIALWSVVWKGLGLWYSGKHQQKGWFIALLLVDLLGLLPIIYLLWFRPKEKVLKEKQEERSVSVRKKVGRRTKK